MMKKIGINKAIGDSDHFTITILSDGTLKTVTDDVSQANHDSAERFLRAVAKLAGGETVIEQRKGHPPHTHSHEHEHSHDGHTHSH